MFLSLQAKGSEDFGCIHLKVLHAFAASDKETVWDFARLAQNLVPLLEGDEGEGGEETKMKKMKKKKKKNR
ncbi:hypothetical protein BGAL_0607g00020 [Botrytis galanthina]|uniref:Uncharacterized protein n=1 Tax=Botrytis galanthina TaxID=278940 RepID=A0A4S8QJ10_9HELO|nr:hypothetical protein BGAL_0607g00020 [Botrytis galanthina]